MDFDKKAQEDVNRPTPNFDWEIGFKMSNERIKSFQDHYVFRY